MIEKRRHTRPKLKAEDRICTRCDTNTVEDEFHYKMCCPKHMQSRQKLINAIIVRYENFNSLSKDAKFCYILSNTDSMTYLIKFIQETYIF